jgi:hypothetical protein
MTQGYTYFDAGTCTFSCDKKRSRRDRGVGGGYIWVDDYLGEAHFRFLHELQDEPCIVNGRLVVHVFPLDGNACNAKTSLHILEAKPF